MSLASIQTIARKELRSYFLSPVALMFLGVFLVATLFIFFTASKFFVRNLADVRPLFSWLPLLLIFLVAAVTMRQWSEEQKMGTLEVLLTLPLKTRDLVLGKFVAGLGLIKIALGLTLPLPITVALLGDLDWGPVVGGYVAAVLVASTYLAIGLCVSARTDNQIVALLVTAIIGSLLYFVGSDSVAGLFGHQGAELLRSVGTGSRFESIERGVLDLRDLAYYGSLTVFFLALNVHFLELKRLESQPREGESLRRPMNLGVLLAGLNVIALNLWLAPVTSVRADLTASGEYSVSDVTEQILSELSEPLIITGYFSQKTHPLLSPLIPRIRDFLTEYEVRGRGNVRLNFVDPNADPDAEEEINDQYGIKSVPFRVSGRNEESVVNSYFHVLIRYGDEYEVLSFDDLIEIHADDTEVIVRLRNVEYDLTKSIKKVTQGFQSIEAVLARAGQTAKLTAYISGELPKEFAEVPERLKKVADAFAEKTGGRLSFEQIDPATNPALAQDIERRYGFRPLAVDLFGERSFYLYLLLTLGERAQPIFLQGALSESDLRTEIEAAIQRLTPGFLKTVGLLTAEESPPAQANPFGPPPAPVRDFRGLEQLLSTEFQVRTVQGDDGTLPGDLDVLIVAKPGSLTEKQKFAVDQYLMRGGAVIALTGAYQVKPDRFGINAVKTDLGWLDQLEAYGARVEQTFVMDPQNTRFPVPVREQRGPFTFERIELVPYPFFADLRRDGFTDGHPTLAGLANLALTWGSPVTLVERDGVKGEVILKSSAGTWLQASTQLQPDFQRFPGEGFGRDADAKTGAQSLAVVLSGSFPSFFADKPSPLFGEGAKPEGDLAEKADRTGRTLKRATPDARLVVVGSSEFMADIVNQLARQVGGGAYRGNPLFIRNLIDWSLADTDLLQIRSAGAFARTLKPLKPEQRTRYELANYLIVLLALAGVVALGLTRRRLAKPIQLTGEA